MSLSTTRRIGMPSGPNDAPSSEPSSSARARTTASSSVSTAAAAHIVSDDSGSLPGTRIVLEAVGPDRPEPKPLSPDPTAGAEVEAQLLQVQAVLKFLKDLPIDSELSQVIERANQSIATGPAASATRGMFVAVLEMGMSGIYRLTRHAALVGAKKKVDLAENIEPQRKSILKEVLERVHQEQKSKFAASRVKAATVAVFLGAFAVSVVAGLLGFVAAQAAIIVAVAVAVMMVVYGISSYIHANSQYQKVAEQIIQLESQSSEI